MRRPAAASDVPGRGERTPNYPKLAIKATGCKKGKKGAKRHARR
jgi:hypothetical protein